MNAVRDSDSRPQRTGFPDLRFGGEVEGRWKYAYDLERLVLDCDGLAQRSLCAAEVVPGKLLADQGCSMRIGIGKRRGPAMGCKPKTWAKLASTGRQYREHCVIAQLHALAAAGVEAHCGETSRLIAYVGGIRTGDTGGCMSAVGPACIENGNSAGVLIGQRREQNGLDTVKMAVFAPIPNARVRIAVP